MSFSLHLDSHVVERIMVCEEMTLHPQIQHVNSRINLETRDLSLSTSILTVCVFPKFCI